ncbi:MAG: ATP-binding protein [Candidatus Methanoperedens sp.]|nr:ATP-binding protein [Candidatus Methanoperedens sp.]
MMSLRFKIIASTMLIALLIIGGSYVLIQDIQTGIIEKEFREKGFLLANHLALEVTNPVLVNNVMEIRGSMDELKASYPDIEYIFVTDSEGIVLAHTFEGGFPKALQNRSRPYNVDKEFVFNSESGIIHEFDAPLFKNVGYVHVGVSENSVREQINEVSQRLLLLAVSAVVLGGIFIVLIGRWLTEPVLRLSEGAKRINKGILNQNIEVNSRDELGELAATFNDMALSLDQKIKDLVASKEQTETAQKYLETLFNSIDDGIIVLNVEHEIIKTNESFLKMLNMTQEQALGRSCHDLIFGTAQQQKQEKEGCPVDTLLRTKRPIRILHEVRINGDRKILEINGSLFSGSRRETEIILVLRDVTQEEILEEEIIRRNRELTVLNEVSKTISETFDLDKILSKTLENLLRLTDMDAGEIYLLDETSEALAFKMHSGRDEAPIPAWSHRDSIESREATIIEDIGSLSRINPAGMNTYAGPKEHYSSFIGIPMRLKDKAFGAIMLGSREKRLFTDRDRQLFSSIGRQLGVAIENISFYNNIKYLKEFNEEILNNVNLAIHVVDKDMRILAVNDELLKFGRGKFKKEQIVGKNLFEAFPFLKEKYVDKEYEYVLNKGEIFQSEERTGYNGDVIHISTSKIPIKDQKGNVEKIITVMKDVSDQKRLEEELKDSYEELRLTYLKLKELYKIKDSFLSNMSHELRTPLTSILGYTELMLEEDVTMEQKHKLEIILRNSQRLSRLIKGLLDTALIESKNPQLDIQTLSLYDLISNVAEDMRTIATIKNIPIDIDVPQQLTVEGDKDRLMQVFSNIVDNAIKFTIKGKINIKAEEEDGGVHIKVDDTGIGIPPEELELIFDRSYLLDPAQAQKPEGAGLGLWVSKNIVEAHEGKIWAESKNRGSTFHVLLPGRRKNE